MTPEPAPRTTETAVADTRRVPLGALSGSAGSAARRVLPAGQSPKLPVAAFDSAL